MIYILTAFKNEKGKTMNAHLSRLHCLSVLPSLLLLTTNTEYF